MSLAPASSFVETDKRHFRQKLFPTFDFVFALSPSGWDGSREEYRHFRSGGTVRHEVLAAADLISPLEEDADYEAWAAYRKAKKKRWEIGKGGRRREE